MLPGPFSAACLYMPRANHSKLNNLSGNSFPEKTGFPSLNSL